MAKKNPFTLLTVDPSSSRAARLVLQGRTLDVTRAVSRDQAEKLRENGERAREKKDTRNLYLMREGGEYFLCLDLDTHFNLIIASFTVIFASSASASSLTKSELERRQASFAARKTLLRSNPSLFISKTRLSVRNLPTWVSERGLKRLAIHAVREFELEVKKGTRAALSLDELETGSPDIIGLDGEKSAGLDSKFKNSKAKRGNSKGRATGVKQSKVVRQQDRVDPLTGKGKSKGYGFLELETHADALRVLRWSNNNKGANRLLWGWWEDELAELVKRTKEQVSKGAIGRKEGDKYTASSQEDLEARVKKLEIKLKEFKDHHQDASVKDGRTLHVEFSIENITVVKRRFDKAATHAGATEKSMSKRNVSTSHPREATSLGLSDSDCPSA
jgi:nucleolar protein 4